MDQGTRWLVSEASVERIESLRRTLAELDEEGNPTEEEIQEIRDRLRRERRERPVVELDTESPRNVETYLQREH